MKKKSAIIFLLTVLIFAAVTGCGTNQDYDKSSGFNNPAGGKEDREVSQQKKGVTPGIGEQGVSGAIGRQVVSKRVYLTFDDGPDSINTPLILNILDSYGVKATFFVIGTNIEKNQALFKEILLRGNAVGNHTYNHKYSDIYSGVSEFLASIKKNEELIYKLTGERPRIIRDPGGIANKNQALKKLLVQNGYRLVDWNVDSYDSRKPYLEAIQIIQNVKQQSKNQKLWPGMIILMHDGKGHLNTVRALPTVIEMLKSQGFQFEVLK